MQLLAHKFVVFRLRAKWGDFSRLISDLDLCCQGVNEIQKENIS